MLSRLPLNPRCPPRSVVSRLTLNWTLVICLLPAAITAADPVVLRNSGEPLRVPFACGEDQLQSVGLVCTEDEPCAIYLELDALALNGRKIFLAGNLHSTSATISSVLLNSDDGGATWKEPTARLAGASLEQVEFYDLDHGWAAGENQYPLPRDPFFLVSTDGGSTWRHRPVTEEGGPGFLQRFWFDSAQHGELIVDAGKRAAGGRFADYESETGGESWMIRSTTDQAPKLKRAPPVFDNPDFRLQPADGGKEYQVEKRLDGKWVPVASFLIEVASCKLKALESKEPPPETMLPEAQPEKDYVEELHLGADPKAPAAKAPSKTPARTPAKTPARKIGAPI